MKASIKRLNLKLEVEASKWIEAWRDVIYNEKWTKQKIADELNEKMRNSRDGLTFKADMIRRFLSELSIQLHPDVIAYGKERITRMKATPPSDVAVLGELAKLQDEVSQLRRQQAAAANEAAHNRVLLRAILNEFGQLMVELGRDKMSDGLKAAIDVARLGL